MSRAKTLQTYIESLPDFKFVLDPQGRYHHIGATLADACLQAGISYSVVKKRVDRIRENYPAAASLKALDALITDLTAETLLEWKAGAKPETFRAVIRLLSSEGIDTEDELRVWMQNIDNRARLATVKGFGAKTIDYLCRLVDIDAVAIDRYVFRFLDNAGITYTGYDDARVVVAETAALLGQPLAAMDYSIWVYLSR